MQGQGAFEGLVSLEDEKKQIVLREMAQILESRPFRNAGRSKQFLQYVVQRKLAHSEPLKERTIGAELFDRPPDYATGDDPVVRVQAGEVRRRLEQYYREAATEPAMRIEIPVGSYSPVFREHSSEVASHLPALEFPAPRPVVSGKRTWAQSRWILVIGSIALLISATVVIGVRRSQVTQRTLIDEFWSPVFSTPQPVLVCLAKTTVYRPTEALYTRYAHAHPGSLQSAVDKFDQALRLDANEQITWNRDLQEDPAFGVARGDAYAAVTLSAFLGKIGKPDQVRIGSDYTFSDLKNSPSVIVGAFNNRWTLQITSNLHFGFVEQNGVYMIRENGSPDQVWIKHFRDNKNLDLSEDTGIVARLLDSGTGQFTIVVAGIGELGTQAAAELVTRQDLLEPATRSLPAGWQKKNLELLVQTTVTDSVPGPPHIIAAYSW
jgi:hypothetical protein